METTCENKPVSWREILTLKHAPALVLVSLGIWLHAADSLLLATMIPKILADVGGDAFVAWTIATYEIGSIVAGAAAAVLLIRLGLRAAMAVCAFGFAFGCLVSALAPNMALLLLGRVFQGAGGGGLVALAFIAIGMLFEARLQPRVIAVISALWGASAFLGPMIGAFFVHYATWRWGFAAFLVQALALALLILLMPGVPGRGERGRGDLGRGELDRGELGIDAPNREARLKGGKPEDIPTLPLRRLLLLTLGTTLIAASGIEVSLWRTPLLILAAFAMLVLFLRLDDRAGANRMLPRRAFRLTDRAGAALLMWMMMSAGVMGLISYGPVLLSGLHGTPPVVVGYILAMASFGWTLAAIAVSGAPEHRDPFWIVGGMTVAALSVVGLLFSMGPGPVWAVAVFAFIEGLGFGAAYSFLQRRARRVAEPEEVVRVTGALPTVARFGYAVGAAFCGVLANAAGFSSEASEATLRLVSTAVFAGSLAFILIGLLAMRGFVRPE